MAVNFPLIHAQDLHPVPGVQLGIAQAGIKKPNRDDLLLIQLAPGASVAAVFTQNRFCAAPVHLCRQHLAQRGSIRALVINTGCANAGTGARGEADALATCQALAHLLNCQAQEILPFSTGVIMEFLPLNKLLSALPQACQQEADWWQAAHAIMTTDTQAKAVSRQLQLSHGTVTISGISKGAGMIAPNMATMLGFIATDALVPSELLQQWCQLIANDSFNAITVDGDTSTNDSFILMASGQVALSTADQQLLFDALLECAQTLAQMIVRDGEGATKLITIAVAGGRSQAECKQVARAIAHSPLVKTAFFASDPNLGRILAAIGYAGITDLDPSLLCLWLNQVLVAQGGARAASYDEAQGQALMQAAEITVRVDLGRGPHQALMWTCDLSHEYVTINAEYRT